MNYHIVNQKLPSRNQTKSTAHHDWHFQATLFGAAVFLMLILPLTNAMNPTNRNTNVLGSNTQISGKVYDSQYGYYEVEKDAKSENTDIFTQLINSLLSLFE